MVKIRKELRDLEVYVPGKPIEELQREMGLRKVVKLASNENAFGPSPKALEALKSAIYNVHRYPDDGCFSLREKLSERLNVKGENLIFGNGSDELIILAMRAFLERGEGVILAEPTYLLYRIAAKAAGLKVETVPLKDMRYDLETMASRISEDTRLILVSNPNNPTGTYVTRGEVESFIEEVPNDVLLFFDEAYYEFALGGEYPNTIEYLGRGNIITSRTFAKIYGLAGLRIGYAVADREVADVINRIREPFNVNLLGQAAALAALDDEEYADFVRRETDKGKKYLYEEFSRLGLAYVPSATNFVLVRIGPRAGEVYQRLLREGIIVRQMDAWKLNDYIRVTVGREEENRFFIERLETILRG
ncbi:histidinol-phosphate transaminase [Candidatus Bathyarchaeota archaeon]|nr:histidinol-phosphate transaminase [Candidatus Bathyarchaeota archaeon]